MLAFLAVRDFVSVANVIREIFVPNRSTLTGLAAVRLTFAVCLAVAVGCGAGDSGGSTGFAGSAGSGAADAGGTAG
ncbi:MAG TPA: hypothetical protein VKQ32_07345, partial [Polyangia bacterium]|nr:hypothetical protein [Polyangia bacterium]